MQRILVVLPNWYGETLFATPFLRALHLRYPEARIVALGWPRCQEILQGNPHVHDFLSYEERGAHRRLAAKWQLIRAIRRQRFDVAFLLRPSLSRSLLIAAAGISKRIGFDQPKSGWVLTHRAPLVVGRSTRAVESPRRAHKAETYFALLETLGGPKQATMPPPFNGRCPFDYIVSEAERQAARAWYRQHGVADGRPLIVLHPGANWVHKRWDPQRFAALGDRLAGARRAQIVVSGGPEDVALAQDVSGRMQQPALVAAGQTTLRALAALLEQAHLVIANDTGVLHVAAALHRPLVALYGPTSPLFTGPLGDEGHSTIIHHPECCPTVPCYDAAHPPHAGMASISVDEVYDAAVRLLK